MRGINKITVFDAEPVPNVDEMLTKFSGYSYFSRSDLAKGYWQVPLKKSARDKTAFQTGKGLFQFCKMPFGLVNSQANFSRLMRKLLEYMENIDNFVDDIIVFTKTWNEHLSVIRELLVPRFGENYDVIYKIVNIFHVFQEFSH